MMGEDVYEYEKNSFESVNEMRDFVRILSMNHSDLVGHIIKKPFDIEIRHDKIGKNVGDKIEIDDKITLSADGKILSVTRKDQKYDFTEWDKSGVLLIVQDKYTYETKIVNFGLVNGETGLTDGTEKSISLGEKLVEAYSI